VRQILCREFDCREQVAEVASVLHRKAAMSHDLYDEFLHDCPLGYRSL